MEIVATYILDFGYKPHCTYRDHSGQCSENHVVLGIKPQPSTCKEVPSHCTITPVPGMRFLMVNYSYIQELEERRDRDFFL